MKKILALLLSIIMILSLCACDSNEKRRDDDDDDTRTETEEAENLLEEVFGESLGISKDSTDAYKIDTTVTIEETKLYDQNNITITAQELIFNSYNIQISFLFENLGSEAANFTSKNISVNGFMVSGYLYCDVAAGKKATDTCSISNSELELLGIETIADITLQFEIDDDSYTTEELHTEALEIKTSEKDNYKYVNTYRTCVQDKKVNEQLDRENLYYNEESMYSEKSVTLLSQALISSDDSKYLLLEFANASEQNMQIVIGRFAINNLVVTGTYYDSFSISAGKVGVMSINLTTMTDEIFYEDIAFENFSTLDFDLSLRDAEHKENSPAEQVSINLNDKKHSFNKSGETLQETNGVSIVSKGIFESTDSYSNYFYFVFLIENNSGKTISVDDSYNSVSINNFMVNPLSYSINIGDGQYGLFYMMLSKDDAKEVGVSALSDFTNFEMVLEIRDEKYHSIAEPTIAIAF